MLPALIQYRKCKCHPIEVKFPSNLHSGGMGFNDSFGVGVCVCVFPFKVLELSSRKTKWCLGHNLLTKLPDSFLEKMKILSYLLNILSFLGLFIPLFTHLVNIY